MAAAVKATMGPRPLETRGASQSSCRAVRSQTQARTL
jgi:hypothetical protein